MIAQGIIMGLLIIFSYFVGQYIELGYIGIFESVDGMSMAFLTTNFIELFHAVCMRSQRGSIFKIKTFNWWLFGAVILTTLLTISVIYVPFLANLFELSPISIFEFVVGLVIAFLVVPIIEIVKFIQRKNIKE